VCRVVALALVIVLGAAHASAAPAAAIRGVVFDDTDGDGRQDDGERGVPGAVVAYDVRAFTTTDGDGAFALPAPTAGNGLVWVRVPDGFVPGPVWQRVVAGASVELGLRRLPAPHRGPLTFAIAADTHLSQAQPFADDLAAVVAGATALDPAPAFITILGDITQGNEDAHFDLVDAGLASLEVPYVPVPGNHDWYDGGATWFRRYGPDNYSFDIDRAHFVVWNMAMPVEDITRYLGEELARVAPDMTIVALTHAPPVPPILAALRRLGVDYVLSGHTHTNRAVDHGGIIELTTEPLLMGGLDLVPAGYRVATLDRGVLSTSHRTVVEEPHLAVIAPAAGACAARRDSPLIVAAELDAGTATVTARVDCGTPIELRYAGGWTWRADLPALAPGAHTVVVDARAPSGLSASRTLAFEVCAPAPAEPPRGAWPQLGGSPRHAGASPRAIAPPLEQRWATTIGGHVVHAAPAIADGVVFVTATDLGDGDTGGVVAIDLATGATRWRVATPVPVRGAPAVAAGTVAVGQLDGAVLGLDAQTGARRWRYELGLGLTAEAASLFASVAADGDELVVGNQRHLAAIAGEHGAPRWTADPVPEAGYSQSLAAVALGDTIAVGVFHRELGGLIAWDRATGRERWRISGEPAIAINASPVIAGDTAYVVNGATEVVAIDLERGLPRWQVKLDDAGFEWGNATIGTPALAHGVLVVPTLYRDVVALDAMTGAELWRFAGTPSPLRTTHYRGAREAGFEASPVITGDIAWVADTAGRLSALELRTGTPLGHVDLGVPVLAGLAAVGDWLVVASYDGSVRAFAPATHAPRPLRPGSCDVAEPAGCCDAGASPTSPLGLALVVLALLYRRRVRA